MKDKSKSWAEVEKLLHGFASRLWIPPTPEEKELYDKVIPKLINRTKSLYNQNIQSARAEGAREFGEKLKGTMVRHDEVELSFRLEDVGVERDSGEYIPIGDLIDTLLKEYTGEEK